MDFNHETVLLNETVEMVNPKSTGKYIDATLGGGGHTSLLLEQSQPDGKVLAFDQDQTAIDNAKIRFADESERLTVVHSNFREMKERASACGFDGVDGILFDLGVSSPQFDIPERGFSYRFDGPLDMRMDQRQTTTAQTFINESSVDEMTKIFFRYGEEKYSRAIARRIVEARSEAPIDSTLRLADIIKDAIPAPARRTGPHPARRVFQAIRIAVNNELGVLEEGLEAAFALLRPQGRLCVISFHSLEDRIVKQTFKDFATGCICPPDYPICTCGREPQGKLITRKPIEATKEELDVNPRARSAKLRVIEKR